MMFLEPFATLSSRDAHGTDGALFDPLGWRRLEGSLRRLLASTVPGQAAAAYPPLSVHRSEGGALVRALVPGLEPSDVEVSVEENRLTISGTLRHVETEGGGEIRTYRRERGEGRFARTIELPFRVESAEVSASLKHGVLEVSLPRVAEERPRRIEIRTDG